MKKTAVILMFLAIFSKSLGFFRDIILSYVYGTSNISDAYLISETIPVVIFSFVGTSILTGYIPMYNSIEQNHGEKEANRYTNNFINIFLIISSIIIIFGLLFTKQIVNLFASGFEGDALVLSVKFTRISLFGIYFTGVIAIFTGLLQVKGNYVVPKLIGLPFNLLVILAILLSSSTNVIVLAIGSVIAVLSQLLLLLPFVWKKGYRYRLTLDFKDTYIIKMLRITLPIIIGMFVNQINVLVDKSLASNIATGGISALEYANRLNEFIQAIFVMSLATVMFPIISKMAAEQNLDELKKLVSNTIGVINLLVIPAAIGAMLFAEPIVKLLYGRGAFDARAISMTSHVLFFYSIGMIGFGLREVLSRVFYSIQDTKSPMINAAVSVVMNIILSLILSSFMGIGGLALATSISAISSTGLLFISLRRKIGSFGMKDMCISLIKILVASSVMGVLAKLVYNLLFINININLALLFSICIGGLIYLVVIYFMKIKDFDIIIYSVKNKLKREKL